MRSWNRILVVMVGLALAVSLAFPSLGQAASFGKKVNGWEIMADLSGSMDNDWVQGECGAMSKYVAQKNLLIKMNEAIPDLDYEGAFRRFGHKFYISGPEDYSTLIWGPALYEKTGFGEALSLLRETQGITPMEPAMNAADGELSAWVGPKALVILSDFNRSVDFGDPISFSRTLNEKYGADICIYTISFAADEDSVSMASGIAEASGCGKYYDGCTVMTDQAAFDQMIRDIFLSGCPDQDQDGVCDDLDRCPNTPRGAPVNEFGCWVVADDAYFDFDKAIVKDAFKPRIQEAARIVAERPELYITLVGHTDSVGTAEYNKKLGFRRAKAVEKLLIEYGVNAGRIEVESMGKENPTYDNSTAEGRAKNRRVDLNIWEPTQ